MINYVCLICGKGFKNAKQLRSHKAGAHSKDGNQKKRIFLEKYHTEEVRKKHTYWASLEYKNSIKQNKYKKERK